MKEKINIAEILKDKPQGTKLYSSACGKCELKEADDKSFKVSFYRSKFGFMIGGEGIFDKNGNLYDDGECVVFPSKEMRDWAKFAWNKGDVLSCGVDNLCIFEKWANEEYTEFYAKFVTPNYSGNTFKTEKWSKETNEAVIKQYISNIEEFKGGKLNLTTLEIEKQPEFKDGDIVVYGKSVAICRKIYKHTLSFYISLNEMFGLLFADEVESSEEYRFATEEEKQQLFDALEKEGKQWDSEKKMVVDLKPKVELKPFDKVVVRDTECSTWYADFFSHIDVDYRYACVGATWSFCIPYNEETAHLLGTTDEWKGGEG